METKKKEEGGCLFVVLMILGVIACHQLNIHDRLIKGTWLDPTCVEPPAVQQAQKNPATPGPMTSAPTEATKAKYLPEIFRVTGIHRPKPNQNAATPQTATAPVTSGKSTAKQENKPTFIDLWGIDGDSEFAKRYEAQYKVEVGIGLNDSQSAYVKDVIAQDYRVRLYQIFLALGNSITDEKLDAACDVAFTEMTNENGQTHQGKLLAMMDGRQVAMLNSFLSGINAASPQPRSKDEYSPAFEYLWSGGQGDEAVVAIHQKEIESMSGIALNKRQVDFLRSTFVPEVKASSAEALDKLDLSSGNVTGEEVLEAVSMCLAKSFKTHGDKLYALMDENQLRIIKNRAALKNKAKQ